MKDIYVADIEVNQEIVAYFMVKNIAVKTDSKGKLYLDLLIADNTGEIRGKKWNLDDGEAAGLERIKVGNIVKVKGQVTEFNGTKQLRMTKIRLTDAGDMLDINDYIKAAPEDPKEMFDFIYGRAASFTDAELKRLCTHVLETYKDKLMYYPAASKNHHAELAGLLWHMKRMLMTGERVCEVYTNLNCDLLLAGVVLHDIEKMNEIMSDENGVSSGYSFEGKMLGHLVMGVREVEKLCLEMGIGREKTVMLEHMMISHHYEPEWGSPVRPLFPEAEMLHYLDMIDSKMYDMEEAVNSTEPGNFSERVWTLDNRAIYRLKDSE